MGGTLGTEIEFTQEKTDLLKDQAGTTPFNRVLVGAEVMMQAGFVELTAKRMQEVVQSFVSAYNGNNLEGFGDVFDLFEDDLSVAKPIEARRLGGGGAGSETNDPNQIIIFPLFAPSSAFTVAFDASTQRQINTTLQFYRSDKYVWKQTGSKYDGSPMTYWSASAWTNGYVEELGA
jgi:hypothetical protein